MVLDKVEEGQIIKCYIYPYNESENKTLTYEIDKQKKKIIVYVNKYNIKEVILEDFTSLPPEFSEKGYIKSGLLYLFYSNFKEENINKFIIRKDILSKISRTSKGLNIYLDYEDLKKFKKKISKIRSEGKSDLSYESKISLNEIYPDFIKKPEESNSRKLNKVITYLDTDIIENLKPEDVNKLLDFFEELLNSKYTSEIHKRRLLNSAKIKVDNVAIDSVIKNFDDLLKENPNESKWGIFLKRNLFLVDSKYVSVIQELNVMLSGSRKVDFGLIDSEGYLDIFEIKKPNTQLLAKNTDRGNFYWHTETIKAIVQAEKYLHNAERKGANLVEDIARENELEVKIVKPKAYIIIGTSSELDTNKKKEDFRILRNSLKNIDIILYDELLTRIKNQKNKTYIE